MTRVTKTAPKPSKTKAMLTPDSNEWNQMKIHAVSKGYTSAQALLEKIMHDWLQENPIQIVEGTSQQKAL